MQLGRNGPGSRSASRPAHALGLRAAASGASGLVPFWKDLTKNANQSVGVTVTVPDANCSGEADTHSLVTRLWRMRVAPIRHSSSSVLAEQLSHRATCFLSLRAVPINLQAANAWERLLP